ncbi:MAG: hypothetical protein EA396_11235 [Anaerolineaceae bacterium]|nr:MAG: hypothetical protein EA396_11235 [Anaerolineaceae bacterium]
MSTFISPDPFQINFTESSVQALRVAGSLTESQMLSFSGGEVRFSAAVHAPDGRLLGVAISDQMGNASFNVPAADGVFTIIATNLDASPDAITMTVSAGSSAPVGPSTDASQPASTPQPAGPPPSVCTITTGDGGTNLRTGPGTSYGIIVTLPGGSSYPATGQNSGWYTIDYQGQTGWIFGGVTTVAGPCSNLTFVQAPAPPDQPSASTPEVMPTMTESMPMATSTATMEGMTGPTMAPPTMAPPTMAPPTMPPPTEVQGQIAPPTADQITFEIDRDAGGVFAGALSSPEGNNSDRIRIRVSNLSSQPPNSFRRFNVTLACSGPDAGNLRWGPGGPSQNPTRSCNSTIEVTHTFDSNQTFLNVAMIGPGYVDYTIIVTRSN